MFGLHAWIQSLTEASDIPTLMSPRRFVISGSALFPGCGSSKPMVKFSDIGFCAFEKRSVRSKVTGFNQEGSFDHEPSEGPPIFGTNQLSKYYCSVSGSIFC